VNEDARAQADVVVVGAGFSGLISLVQLLRRCDRLRAAIVEHSTRPRPGVAYGACRPVHVLNVPAIRMGAFADDPEEFFRWLDARDPGRFAPDDFVPRASYGDYLNDVVSRAIADSGADVERVTDTVDGVERQGPIVRVSLASGRAIDARAVILAVGLPAALPSWMSRAEASRIAGVVGDPWASGALDAIPPDDPVAIVGTGLTALDVLQALDEQRHRGPVTFVSRTGRFPLPHAARPERVELRQEDVAACAVGAKRALQTVRRMIAEHVDAGGSWQDVVDGLRHHSSAIWQKWPLSERDRFVRLLRRFWDVHRHRAPAHVLASVQRGVDSGRIRVFRGSVAEVARDEPPDARQLRLSVRGHHGEQQDVRTRWVVNCIGPAMKVDRNRPGLLGALLRNGTAVADPYALGLRADAVGRLISRRATVDPAIFLVGALRRADLWESTAVPELRRQAATVAEALAALFTPSAPGTASAPGRCNPA